MLMNGDEWSYPWQSVPWVVENYPLTLMFFLLKAPFSSRIFNTNMGNSQVTMDVSTLKLSNDLDDLGVSTS